MVNIPLPNQKHHQCAFIEVNVSVLSKNTTSFMYNINLKLENEICKWCNYRILLYGSELNAKLNPHSLDSKKCKISQILYTINITDFSDVFMY